MIVFSGLVFPSFFFLLIFVWFSSDCCCHLFFHHWEFYSLFFFLFFVKQMWRRLFGFQINDIGKGVFPWWVSWILVDFQIGSGRSASFDFGELSGEKAGVK